MRRSARPVLAALLLATAAFAAGDPPFAGAWKIVEVSGGAPPDIEKTDFKTLEKGRVGTSVGCNRIVGGMTVDGGRLAFSQMAATMMACPAPLDAVERSYLDALQEARSWRMEGGTLTFLDAKGAALVKLERAK